MAAAIQTVDPAQNQFLAGLEEKSKKPSPFFRAMAHRPEALQNFVPFYAAVVGPGQVDRRTKELVYLACSYANRCAFCTAAHVASSRKAGVTEDDLRALQSGQMDGFSAAERAAIAYALELTRSATGAATRAAALEQFSDAQVVEITLVAAMANFTNRFNNGLGILPEE